MAKPKNAHISLSDDDVAKINAVQKDKKTPKTILKRCQILLDLDDAHGTTLTYGQCARANDVCLATIANIVNLYFDEGLDRTLILKRSTNSDHAKRKVDKTLEAKIIAIATGEVPEGKKRWTLRLLEEELKIRVGKGQQVVNKETIRRTLKRTNISLMRPKPNDPASPADR